jgi:hypothetical protein
MTGRGVQPGAEWEPYLEPGEMILWQGRPATAISWRGGEMGTVLLGAILLGILGVFPVLMRLEHAGPGSPWDDTSRWGAMIFAGLAVGVALSGPLIMRMVRRGTWYTLTSRRAIIAYWPILFGRTVTRSLHGYPISDVQVVASDVPGLDTVFVAWDRERAIFDTDGEKGWRGVAPNAGMTRASQRMRDHRVGFERVADAAELARLCRQVQEQGQGDG